MINPALVRTRPEAGFDTAALAVTRKAPISRKIGSSARTAAVA